MRAVQIERTGGPEVLQVVDVPTPHAGPGQVRIAVQAAAVNPIDWMQRSGMVPTELPRVLGLDAAGIVDEVGQGVDRAAVGDAVFGTAIGGAYAEEAVLTDWAPTPQGLTPAEAAALPVPVETAVRVLGQLGLEPGHVLLINGAAGGVGLAAAQVALARGARVVGTASEANADFLRSFGVLPTTYGPGLVERVRALVPQVDRALDTSGQGALPDLIALTGTPEHVITIADRTAQEHGVRVSSGGARGELRAPGALQQARKLVEAGQLRLPITATYPLHDAAEAHRRSETRHLRGKLVLLPERAS